MLKMHQRLALITTIPLIATVATSFGAGGRDTSSSARWAHLALGSATGRPDFTAAYLRSLLPGFRGRKPGVRSASTRRWRGFMARA